MAVSHFDSDQDRVLVLRQGEVVALDEGEAVAVGEGTPLLSKPEADTSHQPKGHAIFYLQVGLSTMGVLVGMLYWKSSQTCSEEPECGMGIGERFPSLAIPPYIEQLVLFGCGAAEIAITNAWLSFLAIPAMLKLYRSQPSAAKKALVVAGSSVYVPTQAYEKVLIGRGTGASAGPIAATVLGVLPGALFSYANLVPLIASKVQERRLRADPQQDARLNHYVVEQNAFNARVESNLKRLFADINIIYQKYQFKNEESFLAFLSQKDLMEFSKKPWRESQCRQAGTVLGGVVVSIIMGPITLNIYNELNPKDELGFFPMLLAAYFSLGIAFGATKLTVGGMRALFHGMKSLWQGESLPSAAYQTHPRATLIAWLLGFMMASQSYSTLFMLVKNKYPDDWALKHAVGKSVIAAIVICHFFGADHLWDMILSKLTKRQEEQLLFELVEMCRKDKTVLEFIDFVKDAQKKGHTYGIALHALDLDGSQRDVEAQKSEKKEEAPPVSPAKQDKAKLVTTSSWYDSAMSMFTSCLNRKKHGAALTAAPRLQ